MCFRSRLFLASAPRVQKGIDTEDTPRILAPQVPGKCREGRAENPGTSIARMAGRRHLGVRDRGRGKAVTHPPPHAPSLVQKTLRCLGLSANWPARSRGHVSVCNEAPHAALVKDFNSRGRIPISRLSGSSMSALWLRDCVRERPPWARSRHHQATLNVKVWGCQGAAPEIPR